MNKIIIAVVVVAALVLVGGYFLYQNSGGSSTSPQTNETASQSEQNTTPPAPTTHEVVYTDSGYSPQTLTIKVGDTVTWKNNSTHNVWTASGMHPTHTVYSGTNVQQHCPDTSNAAFDECKAEAPGTTWSFTFSKVGEWGYHNHVKASDFGKVIVGQ